MGTDAAQPGTILRGKYRIERVLGKGGMGTVLEATHLDLEKRVAIKVLNPELRTNGELVERFLREGRAAARIDSDHVARVLDVDRQDDGTPFMVMEYLEGSDLSEVRRERRPLPVREAVEYVIQACAGLAKAHALGIVHRDIKPANLFLTRDGQLPRIKVLDFGISKVEASSEGSLTSAGVVMGSAEFMSPEQIISTHHVDARTDIWALGVVLYELLTATTPFGGESFPHVCTLVMGSEPTPVRVLRPEVPEGLAQIIQRCLTKKREGRFDTVTHLADALRATLAHTDVGLGRTPEKVPDAGKAVAVSSSLPIHPAPFAPALPAGEPMPRISLTPQGTAALPSPAAGYPAPAAASPAAGYPAAASPAAGYTAPASPAAGYPAAGSPAAGYTAPAAQSDPALRAQHSPNAGAAGQTSAITVGSSSNPSHAALPWLPVEQGSATDTSLSHVTGQSLPKRSRGPLVALVVAAVAVLGAAVFWVVAAGKPTVASRASATGASTALATSAEKTAVSPAAQVASQASTAPAPSSAVIEASTPPSASDAVPSPSSSQSVAATPTPKRTGPTAPKPVVTTSPPPITQPVIPVRPPPTSGMD